MFVLDEVQQQHLLSILNEINRHVCDQLKTGHGTSLSSSNPPPPSQQDFSDGKSSWAASNQTTNNHQQSNASSIQWARRQALANLIHYKPITGFGVNNRNTLIEFITNSYAFFNDYFKYSLELGRFLEGNVSWFNFF